jgi:hypothetical protein
VAPLTMGIVLDGVLNDRSGNRPVGIERLRVGAAHFYVVHSTRGLMQYGHEHADRREIYVHLR